MEIKIFIKDLINRIKEHRVEICTILGVFFFLLTVGYAESWALFKAFVSFGFSIFFFLLTYLYNSEGDD